nr:immunoglobulin light chain junction region [Macaca mulatta]
CMQAPQTPFTF